MTIPRTFKRGQRLSARDMNRLRANRVACPGQIITSNGTYQRRTAVPTETKDELIWGVVIRELLPADPGRTSEGHEEYGEPVEGYTSYIIRLVDDNTDAWYSTVPYLAGTAVIGRDNRKYVAVDNNIGNDPVVGSEAPHSTAHWNLDPEISPSHLEFKTVGDWRWFVPWFGYGALVPLFLDDDGTYYFLQQMTRVRNMVDGIQTIGWNYIQQRIMAVYG